MRMRWTLRFIPTEPIFTDLSRCRWVFAETSGMYKSIFSCCICLMTLQYLNQILFFEVILTKLSQSQGLSNDFSA